MSNALGGLEHQFPSKLLDRLSIGNGFAPLRGNTLDAIVRAGKLPVNRAGGVSVTPQIDSQKHSFAKRAGTMEGPQRRLHRINDKTGKAVRPLVFVSEQITAAFAEERGMPITPCVCSNRTGTVRRSLRDFLNEIKLEHLHVLENMLSAMSRLDTDRLLDRRFLDLETGEDALESRSREPAELLPVLSPDTL